MDTLISNGGSYEISKKVTDMVRSLFIADYQSEPHHNITTNLNNVGALPSAGLTPS